MSRVLTILAVSMPLLGLGSSAFADRIIASVKVSAKALSRIVEDDSTGDVANPQEYQARNHEQALAMLKAQADRLVPVTPGATRSNLTITKVKHDVRWANTTNVSQYQVHNRFAVTKMSGVVTIFGPGQKPSESSVPVVNR